MNHLDELIDESLDRLYPVQLEQSDWDDILTRLHNVPARRREPRSRWFLAIAAVLVVAAAALAVTTPWRGGPSVIEKASAAISVASAQTVLHERATLTPLVLHCGGRIPAGRCRRMLTIAVELWVEGGTGSRSFREITRRPSPHPADTPIEVPAAPFGNALATSRAQTQVVEAGGTLGPSRVLEALVYQRYSNRLIRYTQAPTAISSTAFDPVALIRTALIAGKAQNAGTAVIAGRPVRVIHVELKSLDRGAGTATYYVDRSTFAPVEIVYPRANFVQFPYTTTPVFGDSEPFKIIVRFSKFETLPATPTTRALAEIRSQHQSAKIVCGVEFGLPDC